MIHNHNYPLTRKYDIQFFYILLVRCLIDSFPIIIFIYTESPFSTKNDQQNKMNNIIRIGSGNFKLFEFLIKIPVLEYIYRVILFFKAIIYQI